FWISNPGQVCAAAGGLCRIISKTSDNFEVAVASGSNLSYPANSLQIHAGPSWLNTGYVVPLNTLLPIAITYDSATKKLDVYANGVPVYSITGPIITHSGELDFGRRVAGAGENYKGIIDEMYLFSEVLTPAEIAALP
ncbi:MAG: LamG domain-containing protein, partial [Candidatus Pacebacteria bacterium]|nr:LamG domain-containing protein [Candidatus Paceibacterota bacterium]